MCNADITIDEIFDALMTLKSQKCTGCDGLNAEWYREFFRHLKEPLYKMYVFAYKQGRFPLSTRRGSLLPKNQKDCRIIQNLCPLTLLNTDYKILAKLFDNRIRSVLPSIIHEDQTGFLSNRNISTNLHKSIDVIEYCKNSSTPAVILSLDMMKCFDRIDYSSIYGSLRFFNFGENFIKWISLFYIDFMVCTQNFGFLSNWFVKSRSANQGCNISPSIYLLSGEILALKLRQNPKIEGIWVGNTELLISQFADDMDLYLKYDKTVLNEVFSTLDVIEANTGLKVSYDKTVLYHIGSLRNTDAKMYTNRLVKWENSAINTLGVNLYQENLQTNFDTVITKMNSVMQTWYYCKLTLMGKVMIVNSLIGSLFVYKMQVIHEIDDTLFQKIENSMSSFVWDNKRPKIPLSTLMLPKHEGGLGLVNLCAKHKSLLMKWVQNVQNNNTLFALCKYFSGPVADNNLCWTTNLHANDVDSIVKNNSFWKTVLLQWCSFNFHEPQNQAKSISTKFMVQFYD